MKLLLTRPSRIRRILTAPFLWHNRFEAWLEERDAKQLVEPADRCMIGVFVTIIVILGYDIVTGLIHHALAQ